MATPSQYCDLEDLFTIGLPRSTVESSDLEQTSVVKAIQDASSDMDAYLANRYVLPLIAWDRSLRSKCVAITRWLLMGGVGFNPEGGGDSTLLMAYNNAIKWLEAVVANRISPQITDSSAAATPGLSGSNEPMVISGSGRGYSSRQTPVDQGSFEGD